MPRGDSAFLFPLPGVRDEGGQIAPAGLPAQMLLGLSWIGNQPRRIAGAAWGGDDLDRPPSDALGFGDDFPYRIALAMPKVVGLR